MTKLTIRKGKIYCYGIGFITKLAVVVKADEGKVLDCGNYDTMVFLCKCAAPINGWDMRVYLINQDNPDEAIRTVDRLHSDADFCRQFILAYESGKATDLADTGISGYSGSTE